MRHNIAITFVVLLTTAALSSGCNRSSEPARADRSAPRSQPADRVPERDPFARPDQPSSQPSASPDQVIGHLFGPGPDQKQGTDQTPDVDKLINGLSGFLDGSDKGAGESAETVPVPKDVAAGGDCANAAAAETNVDAQASARIPLKQGLTLSSIWMSSYDGNFEHECLTQVTAIDPQSVDTTTRCSQKNHEPTNGPRRTCEADLAGAHAYQTVIGDTCCFELMRGSTMFSLSRKAFAELRDAGQTRHHYVDVRVNANTIANEPQVLDDFDGVLKRDRRAMTSVIVNDRAVDLPVIQASGMLDGMHEGHKRSVHVVASILDDERFPLVLDYRFTDSGFAIRYSKISFPSGELEKRLATDKHVDVYGIYFDSASDRLRPESDVVLREISQVLMNHPDWTLAVNGHTDNIGGATENLDLSKRRAAAVKRALVERYKVDSTHLRTDGYGPSRPKDTNETVEGRAFNRRVELVRVG